MADRHVLVTGAAGFIGRALVERLAGQGVRVSGADIVRADRVDVILDVSNPVATRRALARVQPSQVVHAAAIVDDRGDPKRFELVNVEGTRNMLAAAREAGCQRFVQLSSIAALGIDPGQDLNASSPLDPHAGSPYFETKARSEAIVRAAFNDPQMQVVVIRPGDVWGPRSVPWVERPLEMLRKRLPVLVAGGRGLMAPCYIDNLLDGILLALEHDAAANGIFIIHDGVHIPYKQYLTALAEAADAPRPIISLTKPLATALAFASELVAGLGGPPPQMTRAAVRYLARSSTYSIREAQELLGYAPQVDLQEGMALLRHALRGDASQAGRPAQPKHAPLSAN